MLRRQHTSVRMLSASVPVQGRRPAKVRSVRLMSLNRSTCPAVQLVQAVQAIPYSLPHSLVFPFTSPGKPRRGSTWTAWTGGLIVALATCHGLPTVWTNACLSAAGSTYRVSAVNTDARSDGWLHSS